MNNGTPRLVPSHNEHDVTVYIVLNDDLGRANVETDEADVIEKIMSGAYWHPARVVAFNTARGWSCDVTEDVAIDVLGMARSEHHFSKLVKDFIERALGDAAGEQLKR